MGNLNATKNISLYIFAPRIEAVNRSLKNPRILDTKIPALFVNICFKIVYALISECCIIVYICLHFDIKSKKLTNILNYENGNPSKIPIFERMELVPGNKINGQCIISEDQTTLIVSKDFSTKVLGNNFLQMDWIGDE